MILCICMYWISLDWLWFGINWQCSQFELWEIALLLELFSLFEMEDWLGGDSELNAAEWNGKVRIQFSSRHCKMCFRRCFLFGSGSDVVWVYVRLESISWKVVSCVEIFNRAYKITWWFGKFDDMKECTFSIRWRVQMYCIGSASGEFFTWHERFCLYCVGT